MRWIKELFSKEERRHNFKHVDCQDCDHFDAVMNECMELYWEGNTAEFDFEGCGLLK